MEEKKFRILSLEGKDIVGEEINKYEMPKAQSKEYFELFSIFLDYTLETDELINVFIKKFKRSFYFKDKRDNKYTLAIVNVTFEFSKKDGNKKVIMDTSKIREKLYNNGFYIGNEKYVRYKRSAGSSRQGKCLFILEKMLKAMNKWSNCGLTNSQDLASWESYRSLSLSSIKGVINIPIESILFVPDYESKFFENSISVKQEGVVAVSNKENTSIVNNIWDGESLLDESLFKDKYEDKHMLLLRNKFFKSCGFRTKLQKWFKDNNVTTIDELQKFGGVTLGKNIEDIKMVTTPSSLKYLKFKGNVLSKENILGWGEHALSDFGVVKYDKRTKFFKGRMVQSSYQFLNTIPFSEDVTKELLKENIDLLVKIKKNPLYLKLYFTDVVNREKEEKDVSEDEFYSRGQIIFRLLGINEGFFSTKLYEAFKKETITRLRNNFKEGHLILHGTNATLFGNGPELLLSIIGKFNGESVILKNGEIRCNSFSDGEEVVCARSPHVTMGNLYLAKNNSSNPIWEYFDLGNNIVCVNSINENIQQRLNGCDFDSDAMLITNDKIIIENTKKYYSRFLVPVCSINPTGSTNFDVVKLDIATNNNRIGEIVNFSQVLNSLLWDKVNNGESIDNVMELYNDICILAVLSGIEIDKAKRTFSINTNKILSGLREKYKNDISNKPLFFKGVDLKHKNKSSKKEHKYKKYDTAMDYIYSLVPKLANFRIGKERKIENINISDMFNVIEKDTDKTSYNKRDKIIENLNMYEETYKKMHTKIRKNDKNEVNYEDLDKEMKEYESTIKDLMINVYVLYLVVKSLEKNSKDDWLPYSMLFRIDNKLVDKLFKTGKDTLKSLVEDIDGEEEVCGFKYKIEDK